MKKRSIPSHRYLLAVIVLDSKNCTFNLRFIIPVKFIGSRRMRHIDEYDREIRLRRPVFRVTDKEPKRCDVHCRTKLEEIMHC